MAPSIHEPLSCTLGGSWNVPKTAAPKATSGTFRLHEHSIIDIRRTLVESSLKDDIISMMNPIEGPKKLPTLLLYDERGLQLFEEITYLDEYYLTNYEIDVLERSSSEIAAKIPDGSIVMELGSGNLRKVALLLHAFEAAGKTVDYYALDLSRKELERTLAQLPRFSHVSCNGLLGTYDDGREWLKQPHILERSKCIMSLGSSVGNFDRDEAALFLRSFGDVLKPSDTMIIGLDSCSDPAKVFRAYNDDKGITHRFISNGLRHANKLLGENVFDENNWRVIGEYVYDADGGRHQAFYSPLKDTLVFGSVVRPHDRIQVEQSLKYSAEETRTLWSAAGLVEIGRWTRGDEYGLHMLERQASSFSLLPSLYARDVVPSVADWEALWDTWDTVTRRMLTDEELQEKPIKLRHACIFYLGHIPTFLDIQLTRATGETATEPKSYWTIFERGIDPDVDNPEKCHAHSEIPDEWPPLSEILAYQQRVRSRVLGLYRNGNRKISRKVGRGIWLGYEHELMHIETLLYMMLQSDKTLPPPGVERPNFEKLARTARLARVPHEWHNIPEQTIVVGLDNPGDESNSTAHFGWDNESPRRECAVHAFQARSRPITNEEYLEFMYKDNVQQIPTSWISVAAPSQAKTNGSNGTNGATRHGNGAANGNSDRYSNGHSNGDSNGRSNGFSNGSNGGSNGSNCSKRSNGSNGYSNGHSNGHTEAAQSSVPDWFLETKSVRTVFGPVPLKYALDWPVSASYDELAACAAWMGGRIPTFEEARSIYALVERSKLQAKKHTSANGSDNQENSDLFMDLDGANVGFRNWHPTPVTANGNRLCGQGEMGGVWEWTSTTLRAHEGFEAMPIYPGYTADFFDEKHNIVLGGSWATLPRVAGRKTFVNWYQRNYLYPWCGARLVRDMQ